MAKTTLEKLKEKIKIDNRLDQAVEQFKIDIQTKEAIENAIEEPTKENIIIAKDAIKSDMIMSDEEKNNLTTELVKSFQGLFNFQNCPDDYQSLKEEAKFLAGMTQYSFLLMAQRLQTIKLGELYKEDGYLDFKSFIENEINISRRTAYNYIDLLDCFGVQTFAQDNNIEYSKLIPVIPMLRNDLITTEEKENIKKEFIEKAKTESAREINKDVKELKIKYGIEKEVDEDDKEIKKIKDFIEYLKKKNKTHDGEKEVFRILETEIGEYFKRFEENK